MDTFKICGLIFLFLSIASGDGDNNDTKYPEPGDCAKKICPAISARVCDSMGKTHASPCNFQACKMQESKT